MSKKTDPKDLEWYMTKYPEAFKQMILIDYELKNADLYSSVQFSDLDDDFKTKLKKLHESLEAKAKIVRELNANLCQRGGHEATEFINRFYISNATSKLLPDTATKMLFREFINLVSRSIIRQNPQILSSFSAEELNNKSSFDLKRHQVYSTRYGKADTEQPHLSEQRDLVALHFREYHDACNIELLSRGFLEEWKKRMSGKQFRNVYHNAIEYIRYVQIIAQNKTLTQHDIFEYTGLSLHTFQQNPWAWQRVKESTGLLNLKFPNGERYLSIDKWFLTFRLIDNHLSQSLFTGLLPSSMQSPKTLKEIIGSKFAMFVVLDKSALLELFTSLQDIDETEVLMFIQWLFEACDKADIDPTNPFLRFGEDKLILMTQQARSQNWMTFLLSVIPKKYQTAAVISKGFETTVFKTFQKLNLNSFQSVYLIENGKRGSEMDIIVEGQDTIYLVEVKAEVASHSLNNLLKNVFTKREIDACKQLRAFKAKLESNAIWEFSIDKTKTVKIPPTKKIMMVLVSAHAEYIIEDSDIIHISLTDCMVQVSPNFRLTCEIGLKYVEALAEQSNIFKNLESFNFDSTGEDLLKQILSKKFFHAIKDKVVQYL